MSEKIKQLIEIQDLTSFKNRPVIVSGWIRTVRKQKAFSFIELNDGSCVSNLQVMVDSTLPEYDATIDLLSTGAAIEVQGHIVESLGGKQKVELKATSLTLVGACPSGEYPLQKKRHSFEFLRTIAHLRPRTNTQGAVSRIRHLLSFATHQFLHDRGFVYIHTPIITGSDCEGAGELFRVTTLLNQDKLSVDKEGRLDNTQDFFGKPTYLTVSGQLNAEIYAMALSKVYTFGPTFRAENSHTSRHLAEFWMIEPEMAFATLQEDMDLAESYLKYILQYALEHGLSDFEFCDQWIEKGLIDKLKHVIEKPFVRLSYTEAIEILEKEKANFTFPVEWGIDLQSEHERYLAEKYIGGPVILYNYPKEIKAFYMRLNDDRKTVAAMDVLVPHIGEIIGGSQREERYDVLLKRMQECGLNQKDYWWYLELRQFGSCPHAGFGLGLERVVQFATGVENIRDVIPFPRVPGHAEF